MFGAYVEMREACFEWLALDWKRMKILDKKDRITRKKQQKEMYIMIHRISTDEK